MLKGINFLTFGLKFALADSRYYVEKSSISTFEFKVR